VPPSATPLVDAPTLGGNVTSRFLPRLPQSLPVGALAQPEALRPEGLEVLLHRRDVSTCLRLEENASGPEDVETHRFRSAEPLLFVNKDKVSAAFLGQGEDFAFTISEEEHGTDAPRGLWPLKSAHLHPPRSDSLLRLSYPGSFPPLCHDLAIDCWRQDNPPVENPQEIEETTTGKGDEWR